MNCPSCNQSIPDGAKFCPHCKAAITADGVMAKATCPACGTQSLASYAFCPNCAGAMLKALDPAEYDRALDALETLAKGNAALKAELDDADGDDDDEDDDGDGEEDAKLSKGSLPDGLEAVDAAPLIKSLLVANNRIVKQLRSVGTEARATRRDNAVLAKAVSTLMAANKALREKIEGWGSQSRGPRSVRADVFGKSVIPPGGQPKTRDPNDLFGLDLVTKATTVAMGNPTLLSAHDVSRIEGYANAGYALSDIRDADAELAGRYEAAVSTAKQ